jgi:hypothetical protein
MLKEKNQEPTPTGARTKEEIQKKTKDQRRNAKNNISKAQAAPAGASPATSD